MIHANRSTLKVFQAVFALSSFVLAVAAPAATIYKWTDQRGETHYSDKKPAGNQWEIVDESKISVIPSTVPNPPPTPGTATNTATNGDDQLAFDRALAERRQRLLEQCARDRGVDCARQVDTELDAERIQATGRVIHLAPPRPTVSPR
jgi:hypothetical protein